MRRLLAGLALAIPMLGVQVTPAGAWWSWCEDDPPLKVVTPAGRPVEINNVVGGNRAYRELIHAVRVYGYTERAGENRSRVHIFVVIPPGGRDEVRIESRSGRFGISETVTARYGQVVELELEIPVD